MGEAAGEIDRVRERGGEVAACARTAAEAHQLFLLDDEAEEVRDHADDHVQAGDILFERQVNVFEGPGLGVGRSWPRALGEGNSGRKSTHVQPRLRCRCGESASNFRALKQDCVQIGASWERAKNGGTRGFRPSGCGRDA